METNRQRLERLGMMDDETIMDVSQEARCDLCNRLIEKHLSPTNPACEGKWCWEAIVYWLDEEADEEDR
ncbi:MAG: hypothetical protein ACLVML_00650 [Candidatus Gastranaerophilaceae bacterium]|nr:hypothetical protein [Christensenellales bacterium]